MIAGIVLATLTSVASCTQFVHGQCQSLVGLDAQCAERHGTCYEVLYNALNRLHLVDGSWLVSFLKGEEVTEEDRTLLFINSLGPVLEFLIRTLTTSQLQFCDCLWVPSVLDTVLAPGKLSLILPSAYRVLGHTPF